jgi:hypothetical protein
MLPTLPVGTNLAVAVITRRDLWRGRGPMYSRDQYYRPEYYRRLGLAAKQRAAQTDPRLKEQFKDVARLAERVEWVNKHYNDQQYRSSST